MKKFLCSILTAAMLLTSAVMPTFAANSVNMRESDFATIMNEFALGMPADPMERILIWKTFKAYMLDGNNGIDTLISVLDGTGNTSQLSPAMQQIFARFVTPIQATYKDRFILMLQLYKSTTLADRVVSLNKFGSNAAPHEEIDKTPITLSATQQTAADAIYNAYITDPTAMGYLTGHGLGSENFLTLLTPFKGCFKMTNDANGNLVLASYSNAFATALSANVTYASVNNTDIDAGASDALRAYQILTGIVKMFDSFTSQKENMKIVLAHDEIDLYEPNLTPMEAPGSGTDAPSLPGTSPSGPSRPGISDRFDDEDDETADEGFKPSEPTFDTSSRRFSDVEAGSWAEPYIMNLTARKIFEGYGDGTFRPNLGVTRQEMAVAMVRAMGMEVDASMAENTKTNFADNDDIAPWARGCVNVALREKWFVGYDDNEYKPNRIISRQELIAVIMRLAGSTETIEPDYLDADAIHGYAKNYVGHASELGIVNGYPDGTFKSLNGVTRAEVAKILYFGLEYVNYIK